MKEKVVFKLGEIVQVLRDEQKNCLSSNQSPLEISDRIRTLQECINEFESVAIRIVKNFTYL